MAWAENVEEVPARAVGWLAGWVGASPPARGPHSSSWAPRRMGPPLPATARRSLSLATHKNRAPGRGGGHLAGVASHPRLHARTAASACGGTGHGGSLHPRWLGGVEGAPSLRLPSLSRPPPPPRPPPSNLSLFLPQAAPRPRPPPPPPAPPSSPASCPSCPSPPPKPSPRAPPSPCTCTRPATWPSWTRRSPARTGVLRTRSSGRARARGHA